MKSALFDVNDAVIVLLDHQTGLFQTVKDISLAELRANACVLAKLGGWRMFQSLHQRPFLMVPMAR